MRVTILGSSTHYPRPANACSGYLVQSGETSIWVDAGTGTLAELQRHVQLEDVSAIWISHTHADHTSDLLTAYYAYRFGDVQPGAPIPVFAPHTLRERLVAFLGGSAETGLDLVFGFADLGAVPGGGSAQVGDLALSWREVDHDVPGFALRVDGPGRLVRVLGGHGALQGPRRAGFRMRCAAAARPAPTRRSRASIRCTTPPRRPARRRRARPRTG